MLATVGNTGEPIAHPFLSVKVILLEVGGIEAKVQQGTVVVWSEIDIVF